MDKLDLYKTWSNTFKHFSNDTILGDSLWKEIKKAYTSKDRYYHNFNHIELMLNLANTYNVHIKNIYALRFAIIYHDIVYDVKRQDNELKSWEFAENHLKLLVPQHDLDCIKQSILATKDHQTNGNRDVEFMLDFDLYTLGQSWEYYLTYTKQIRKEYSIYPDHLYLNGRIQVLDHFLNSGNIFKTPEFHKRYEHQAQSNIKQEITVLKTLA